VLGSKPGPPLPPAPFATRPTQANRPKLQRTLDRVGEIWSKAVIAATLAALVGLLAAGVPLAGSRGALYR